MQALNQTIEIQKVDKKNAILEAVSDKYSRGILESITYKPKSATEIGMESKIPLSTIYRRLQTLHDCNLISTSGMITEDGKRLFLYKSKIKGICCNFEEGQIDVKVTLNK